MLRIRLASSAELGSASPAGEAPALSASRGLELDKPFSKADLLSRVATLLE